VTSEHPELRVEVSALGEKLAGRVFRLGEAQRLFSIPWPAAAQTSRTAFEFRCSDPARPIDLGLGDDPRRLGLHLEWLMVRRHTWSSTLSDVFREKSANLRRRLGR
jgi:hypothetical protein